MGWLGRSLGDFGSQLGEGYDISQSWKERAQKIALEQSRQKLAEMSLPLQLQEIQARLKQMNQPKEVGLANMPGGGQAGITFDPNTSKYGSQTIIPGLDKNAAKAQIGKMAEGAGTKEAKATLQAYADSIDVGEDPSVALQKALAFMGTSATHQEVSGRVKLGGYVPDKESITGISRQKMDGMGNIVGTIPNVIMPGMQVKETAGWEKAHDDETGLDYLVPKTTVTRSIVPGVSSSPSARAGGKTATPQQGPQGASELPTGAAMPRGARVIGSHTSPEQRDTIKASTQARDAYVNYQETLKDAAANNPRAHLALIFHAVRSMVSGAGRMTQVEIMQEAKAGSYGDQFKRWATMATEGVLPPDQVQQIIGVVRDNYQAKRQAGEESYTHSFPGRTLPPWLRGEQQDKKTTSGTPPPGAKVTSLDDFLKEK